MKVRSEKRNRRAISSKLANVLGVITIISWGSLGLLGYKAASLPPLFVLAVCFWGATLIGVTVLASRSELVAALKSLSLGTVLIGGSFLFTYHYLYFLAFHYAPAVEVSLLNYLWPAFVIVIGNIFFSLGAGWRGLLAAVIGFIGIIVLFGAKLSAFTHPDHFKGFVLALTGAVIWATYTNLRRSSKGAVLPTVTFICALAALLSTIFSITLEQPVVPSPAQWLTLALLTVGPAGGAFFLWDIALRNGNAVFLAVLGYGAPLISTVLLIATGVAEFSVNVLLAALLISAGGLISVQHAKK